MPEADVEKRKVEVSIGPDGYGVVLLDGVDVSAKTQDIDIRLRPGRLPEVDIKWVPGALDVTLAEAAVAQRSDVAYFRTVFRSTGRPNKWHLALPPSRRSRHDIRWECLCGAYFRGHRERIYRLETADATPEGAMCRGVREQMASS